jgi:hypothetical protein
MDKTESRPFLTRFFIAQAKRITVPFKKGIEDIFSDGEKNKDENIDKKQIGEYNSYKDKL